MTFESNNTNPVKTKPRRWFRFRLRTLLILVTLLSVPLGWVGWELDQRRREKTVVAWIEEMGGEVFFYPYLWPDERTWWGTKKDKWFGESVLNVSLIGTNISDLAPLVELKNLMFINLFATPVSEEQVEELRLAIPNCKILFDCLMTSETPTSNPIKSTKPKEPELR